MAKIFERIKEDEIQYRQYGYRCLGCECFHFFKIVEDGGKHTFNKDMDNPTVTPSLLCDWQGVPKCHSYIKNGKVQYLSDCEHKYAGLTIDLPNV